VIDLKSSHSGLGLFAVTVGKLGNVVAVRLDQITNPFASLACAGSGVRDCTAEPDVVADEVIPWIGCQLLDICLLDPEVPGGIAPIVRLVSVRHVLTP
jgi:hypothetical protein